MAKKKVEKKEDSFASKLGNFFSTVWHYIRTGRDYFWVGVRFTLATGIFLFVALSVIGSLISPLWEGSDKVDPAGKVVVFKPSGVVVDQPPSEPAAEWYDEFEFAGNESPIYYPYQDMLEFFEDFKNDDRVSAMIFDPSGLGVSIVYALPIAQKIKEAVDAGKEVIVRTDFMVATDYLLASGASEI